MEHKIIKGLKVITKIIILSLMFLLISSMFFGTLDLFVLFYQKLSSPTPYYYLINVEELYSVFSVLLIIVVGYELFKSMILILTNDKIPVKSILKIASIALANKVITLNIKTIDFNQMIGLSTLIVSVGLSFFFYTRETDSSN
jgi:uncharacterized membrane protein (DUF373 family)